jgi:hypothetical protein
MPLPATIIDLPIARSPIPTGLNVHSIRLDIHLVQSVVHLHELALIRHHPVHLVVVSFMLVLLLLLLLPLDLPFGLFGFLLGFCFLLFLYFSFSFLLKFVKFLALFIFIFSLVTRYDLGTNIVLDMRGSILQLNEVLAILALVGLAAAHLAVIFTLQVPYSFITELTLPGFHGALSIVISVLECKCLQPTILAADLLVHFFFVFFLLTLGHALAAVLALVVLACAADVVHSELGCIDVFVTDCTSFSFHGFSSLLH